MVKRVAVSEKEAINFLELKKQNIKRKIVVGFFPADPYWCECMPLVNQYKHDFSHLKPKEVAEAKYKMEYLRCPRNKSNLTKYNIYCKNCKEQVAFCYAKDESLIDYCDFHYISYHDGKFWQGALGINISPGARMGESIIGIECCCGQDTRDFRFNTTLPESKKQEMVKKCFQGRDFGKSSSCFVAVSSQ